MSDVTVFVSTCDRYQAAWLPFCHGFRKYWPDCPWPLVFMTNHLEAPCGTTVKTGDDRGWGRMMLKALDEIGTPVILYMMEDAWLSAPADTQALVGFAAILLRDEADHLRLCPPGPEGRPPKRDYPGDPGVFVFADDETYRTSLHAGFWRVDALKRLVQPGDGPWKFELNGNARTRGSDRFLCVREMAYLRYPTPADADWSEGVIWRGDWLDAARRYAELEGLCIDFSRRPGDGSLYADSFGWG